MCMHKTPARLKNSKSTLTRTIRNNHFNKYRFLQISLTSQQYIPFCCKHLLENNNLLYNFFLFT